MLSGPSPIKNVLIAVAGRTPAIITETLWTLEQNRGVKLDEIRVITTAEGKRSAISELLADGGAFGSYCKDYSIPAGRIAFSEKSIYVLRDPHGRELEDIRSSEDNRQTADQVFSLLREWTKREDEVLYCSVAGGRKTLGIYLAMILMLCGRNEDTLSHVLVAPLFETGVHDFFYPPPEPRMYRKFVGFNSTRDPVYEAVSSSDAGVELADIPFPKLREAIGGELPLEGSFTEAVFHSQLLLSYLQTPPTLELRLDRLQVTLGSISFRLSRQKLAVYAFFLLEANNESVETSIDYLFVKRFLIAQLERTIDRYKQGEKERYTWETMEDLEDFRAAIRPCISKVNKSFDSALGKNRLSAHFKISTGKSYRVTVKDFSVFETEGRLWRPSRQ